MRKPPNLRPLSVCPLLLSDVLKVCLLHRLHNGISEPKNTPYFLHKSVDRKYKFTEARILSDMNETEAYEAEDNPKQFAIL